MSSKMVEMNSSMKGMVIALMVASGFTEVEFTALQRATAKAGATLKTISCDNGLVNGWDTSANGGAFGHYFPVDAQLGEVLAADLDALLIPGGERSINKLKNNLNTGRILRNMIDGHKPVVLFGAANSLLAVAGREATPAVLSVITETDAEPAAWVEATLGHIVAIAAENDSVSVAA